MASYLPQWLQDVDTVVSLGTAALTFFIYRKVNEVRLSYQRRTRLPEVSKDLTAYATALSEALGSSDILSIKMQVGAAKSLLSSASKLLSSDEVRELKPLIKNLDLSRKKNQIAAEDLGAAWAMYVDLQVAVQIIDQAAKNSRWA